MCFEITTNREKKRINKIAQTRKQNKGKRLWVPVCGVVKLKNQREKGRGLYNKGGTKTMEKERLHKKSVFGSSFVSVEERERIKIWFAGAVRRLQKRMIRMILVVMI